MSAAQDSFTLEQRDQILASIHDAELRTSGEIRLFVENKCDDNVLDRAAFIFHKLKMDKTKERHGVLFYLALASRKFAIIGDSGINSKVSKDFWFDIKLEMQNYFVAGDFVSGLNKGIQMAGEALEKNFPRQKNDQNELPDDIVFGNE